MGARFTDAAAAERAFYEAFAACDLKGMGEVWANQQETVCIHPGGAPLRGKAAILGRWREILGGTSPPSIRHRELQRFANGALSVHLVEELIVAPDGMPRDGTRVLATNVYGYLGDSWRMLEHHASLPLVTKCPANPGTQTRLH